jgi:hypothetical protein
MSRGTVGLIIVMLSLGAPPGHAQTRDVGAMITEIKPGRGRIEVSGPGTSDWRPAGPLLALKVGDSLRATDNASAVVVMAGRRGTVQVDAARSPFLVTAPPAESKAQKAFLLLESGLGFIGSNARETPRPVLSTRSVGRPPVILSPRAGPVMPDALAFEWQGYQFGRFALRVVAGSTVVLERSGLTGTRLAYPADAPALAPGTPYTLQLFSGQSIVDEIRFEVADRQRAEDLRRDLREVDQALGPDVPRSSRAVMQAGVLASRGFLHDARGVVVAALTVDADQPSLHALLGDLYARTGLPREADEAYQQARDLASPPAR